MTSLGTFPTVNSAREELRISPFSSDANTPRCAPRASRRGHPGGAAADSIVPSAADTSPPQERSPPWRRSPPNPQSQPRIVPRIPVLPVKRRPRGGDSRGSTTPIAAQSDTHAPLTLRNLWIFPSRDITFPGSRSGSDAFVTGPREMSAQVRGKGSGPECSHRARDEHAAARLQGFLAALQEWEHAACRRAAALCSLPARADAQLQHQVSNMRLITQNYIFLGKKRINLFSNHPKNIEPAARWRICDERSPGSPSSRAAPGAGGGAAPTPSQITAPAPLRTNPQPTGDDLLPRRHLQRALHLLEVGLDVPRGGSPPSPGETLRFEIRGCGGGHTLPQGTASPTLTPPQPCRHARRLPSSSYLHPDNLLINRFPG